MERLSGCNPLSKASKNEVRVITDEVMTVRLREAQLTAELKDSKQRLMEQETQQHIAARQVCGAVEVLRCSGWVGGFVAEL